MKDLTRGLVIVIVALISSAFVSALMLRTDVESLMDRIENAIIDDNAPAHLCELHSRFGLVSIYVISNPFRDYSKFERANEVCKNQ